MIISQNLYKTHSYPLHKLQRKCTSTWSPKRIQEIISNSNFYGIANKNFNCQTGQDNSVNQKIDLIRDIIYPIPISNSGREGFLQAILNADSEMLYKLIIPLIGSIEDKEEMFAFGELLKEVLKNNYPKMRYDLTKNEDLEKIFAKRPKLLKKWMQGEEMPLEVYYNKMVKLSKGYPACSFKDFKIVDTDDYVDIFQAVIKLFSESNYQFNELIATVLDGKNRLIAIKDKNDALVAIQLFRILNYDNKPALFVEDRFPSFFLGAELGLIFESFVEQRAKKLELPLYTNKIGERPLDKSFDAYINERYMHLINGTFTINHYEKSNLNKDPIQEMEHLYKVLKRSAAAYERESLGRA